MIKYQVQAKSHNRIAEEKKAGGEAGGYDFYSGLHDTKTDAEKYASMLLRQENKYWAITKIFEVEVNFTDDEEVAKREGYKSFWLEIYEEAKYVKQYWAKDEASLETDEATEVIQEHYNDGDKFEWIKGSEDWTIHEDTTEEVK